MGLGAENTFGRTGLGSARMEISLDLNLPHEARGYFVWGPAYRFGHHGRKAGFNNELSLFIQLPVLAKLFPLGHREAAGSD